MLDPHDPESERPDDLLGDAWLGFELLPHEPESELPDGLLGEAWLGLELLPHDPESLRLGLELLPHDPASLLPDPWLGAGRVLGTLGWLGAGADDDPPPDPPGKTIIGPPREGAGRVSDVVPGAPAPVVAGPLKALNIMFRPIHATRTHTSSPITVRRPDSPIQVKNAFII